jgi:DNA ligase (NAD+)
MDDLSSLERMGKKSSENLLAGIEASKERGLARLLNGLSIRHVGATVARILTDHFGSMEALQKASLEEIGSVSEIGPTIAESVHKFVQSDFGKQTIDDLRKLGVKMESDRPRATQGVLSGKTLVVTGTLTKYTRDEIHDLIAQHGGRAASSVSSKTDYVVAGDKAGSKLDKAQKLGVKVISEDDFERLIAT